MSAFTASHRLSVALVAVSLVGPGGALAASAPSANVPAISPTARFVSHDQPADAKRRVTLTTAVFFTQGQSTVGPTAAAKLDELVAQLNGSGCALAAVTLWGWEPEDEPRELGRQRADAVRDFLLAAGLPEAAVVADTDTVPGPERHPTDAAAAAKTRRVEVVVSLRGASAGGLSGASCAVP